MERWNVVKHTLVSAAVHPSGSHPLSLLRRGSYRSAVAVTTARVPASTTTTTTVSSSSPPLSTPSSTRTSTWASKKKSGRENVIVFGALIDQDFGSTGW